MGMSFFEYGLQYVLTNEGQAVVLPTGQNAEDRGGLTKCGITLKTYREVMGNQKTELDLRGITLVDVREFYLRYAWKPMHLEGIESRAVAVAMMDVATLCGVSQAVLMAQDAVNVPADGIVGDRTLSAIAATAPKVFIGKLSYLWQQYLYHVVSQRPSQQRFLRGWLYRAVRLYELLLPPIDLAQPTV